MDFKIFFILILVFSSLDYHEGSLVKRDCVCGEANIKNNGRIVNGKTTTKHKYPWVAGMFLMSTFMCGGAIISDRNILTAGHCYFYMPHPLQTLWVLGMHDQTKKDGKHHYIEDYVMHPKFTNFTIYDDYDVAIVRLKKYIIFDFAIKPICFNSPGDSYVGKKAIVSGWGRLNDISDNMGIQLQETRVRVKNPQECTAEVARLMEYNDDSMLCAHEKGTDSCNGDSGGPLFIETHPNRYEIIGLVSFGDGCAREFPGIYAKTANHQTQKWIKEYIAASRANVCSDPAGKINEAFFDEAFDDFFY